MPPYHEFVLRATCPGESVTNDLADALYDAGCGDGTMSWRGGVFRIRFSRRARTREDAIQSAIMDMASVGVEAVEDTEDR
jgi:hypothetical protein